MGVGAVVAFALLGVWYLAQEDNVERARKTLDDAGYSDIQVQTGDAINWTCGDDEISYAATATNSKRRRVDLVVCCDAARTCYVRSPH